MSKFGVLLRLLINHVLVLFDWLFHSEVNFGVDFQSKIVSEFGDDLLFATEAGNVDRRVAETSLDHDCAVAKQELNQIGVALVSRPMKSRHPQLWCHEVYVGPAAEEKLDEFETSQNGCGCVPIKGRWSTVALETDQVEGRVAVVVYIIHVEIVASRVIKFFENPMQHSCVTVSSSPVNWTVSIFIPGFEDLIESPILFGVFVHFVKGIAVSIDETL